MELDTGKLNNIQKQYQNWLQNIPQDIYQYDNCICCCFADTLAQAAKKDGFMPWKVCALGSKRSSDLETANLQNREALQKSNVNVPMFNENNQQFEMVGWDYHMAFALEIPCYKDSHKVETIVFDPVLFGNKIATLEQWQKTLACPDYLLRKSMDGYPLNGRGTGYWLDDDPSDKTAKSRREIKNLQNKINTDSSLPKHRPLISQLDRALKRVSPQFVSTARASARV